jgi:adenosylcobyric acid synthase
VSQAFHGGQLSKAARDFNLPPESFVDFSSNLNVFAPAVSASDWERWRTAITRYPQADAACLRDQLANVYNLDARHILPTAGAIDALYLAARIFHGRKVAIIEPAFGDYNRAFAAAGCAAERLALAREMWHAPATAAWAHLIEPFDVIVLGNPNNPTGSLQPRELLLQLFNTSLSCQKSWLVDEAFIEFVANQENETLLPVLKQNPSLIVVRSLTKSWCIPGLRLGFLATSNSAWLDRLRVIQPPWSANAVVEEWAAAFLTPEHHAQLLAGLRDLREIKSRFELELARIPGLRTHSSAANFLLVEITDASLSAAHIYRELGRRGLLVRVCDSFYAMPRGRFIRIAVRTEPENNRLAGAFRDLRGAKPKIPMKAISVVGTSSNSGKSWLATALCAWLRRKGVNVAPFKAQNMSNNSFVTLDGGEIGRAQAAQAEACGLLPTVKMNPILLKPSGQLGSQLVVLGEARGHVKAADYYTLIEQLWPVICETLEHWKTECDVLVLEGAGSPVELNLMTRDIVNLRPAHHLDGKWLLVADIERGGVFAQIIGTWSLLDPRDQARGLGVIVNKFRGDLSLFADARQCLAERIPLPYLGVLPFRADLQPESEDSLCRDAEERGDGEKLAWIRFPHLSNSQDCQPWLLDEGVRVQWAANPDEIKDAKAIVLPGTKNTLADLEWLRATGLDQAVKSAARRGVPVIGICGGYQMLGERVCDPDGVAGDRGVLAGLSLLPVQTTFSKTKEVSQVSASWENDRWTAYAIHMGLTQRSRSCDALLQVQNGSAAREEGCQNGNVWGTYLHGLFESASLRAELARRAGLTHYQPSRDSWREHLQRVYDGMADALEEHLNMEEIWRYVAG